MCNIQEPCVMWEWPYGFISRICHFTELKIETMTDQKKSFVLSGFGGRSSSIGSRITKKNIFRGELDHPENASHVKWSCIYYSLYINFFGIIWLNR